MPIGPKAGWRKFAVVIYIVTAGCILALDGKLDTIAAGFLVTAGGSFIYGNVKAKNNKSSVDGA